MTHFLDPQNSILIHPQYSCAREPDYHGVKENKDKRKNKIDIYIAFYI